MTLPQRPIGVFDSGIGGLTVVRALRTLLPRERILYLGDTARVPYGSKSRGTVARFAVQAMAYLRRRRVKLIVVACNTVSSVALPACRRAARVPVVGVLEPGARAAVAAAPGGRIGVLGTRATIGSGAYARAIRRLRPGARVVSQACPLFVPLAEEGLAGHGASRLLAQGYLRSMRAVRVEAVVLGCTHYPLLKPVISRCLGPRVRLVDSALETAAEVSNVLRDRGWARRGPPVGATYHVTDAPEWFRRVAGRFLGGRLENVRTVRLPELSEAGA